MKDLWEQEKATLSLFFAHFEKNFDPCMIEAEAEEEYRPVYSVAEYAQNIRTRLEPLIFSLKERFPEDLTKEKINNAIAQGQLGALFIHLMAEDLEISVTSVKSSRSAQ